MTTVPDRGWDRLDAATKQLVLAVIAEAERTGEYASEEVGQLDIHARPYGDDIGWGVVNGAENFCIARGLWPRAHWAVIAHEHQPEASRPQLDDRELATVLAALRYWQREALQSAGGEHDIASDGGVLPPLTPSEIDTLCERLNGSQIALLQTAAVVPPAPLEQAGPSIRSDHETEAALAEALAIWRQEQQRGSAPGIIPLRQDAGHQDPAERRNAIVGWAGQLDAAKDEAEFHRVFASLQGDASIDARAARYIAFALSGERYETREAALGGIESHYYQQRLQHQQPDARIVRAGAAR